MTLTAFAGHSSRFARFAALGVVLVALAGCGLFGSPKIKEEAIVPPEELYKLALADMDAQRYATAVTTLEKLERQHPFSEFNEKARMMEVYGNYRIGKFDEALLAADRYLAL